MVILVCMGLWTCGCGEKDEGSPAGASEAAVLADTSFMADIARNVAGDRLAVTALLPVGADPHSFEPTPQDAKRVAECRAMVINSTGLIPLIDDLIEGAARSDLLVIEAAAGLPGSEQDPHLWLDPLSVVGYVDNIAAGFSVLDPGGADGYRARADSYAAELRGVDAWIVSQVATIPAERRLLVTNHENLNYFAQRYGFTVVGAVFPTVDGAGSPSAQQLTALIKAIEASGAPAVFLEAGANTDLARQVAGEAGVKLVTDLLTHSLDKGAPTYLDMMRWNVDRIVEALR